MKTFLLFAVLFFCFATKGQSQQITDTLSSPYQLDSLSQKEWNNFDAYMNKWFSQVFLKKYNIKITCAHCNNVYLTFILSVDASGKNSEPVFGPNSICGSKFSEKQKKDFKTTIQGFKFKLLQKRIIRFHVGRGLKC